MLGLIGEYLGRAFLTINQRPQAVVRAIVANDIGTHEQEQDRPKARPLGAVDSLRGPR
jgi:hypothetical protein